MSVIVALALMVVVEEAMAMVVAAVVVAAVEAVLTNYELPCILVTVKRHWIAIKISL